MRRPAKALVAVGTFAIFVSGCGPSTEDVTTTSPLIVDTVPENLPTIEGVTVDKHQLPEFDTVTITVNLTAEYTNPFDAREVRLDAEFMGPSRETMLMPGYWDPRTNSWQIRFAPTEPGEWGYRITVTDHRGESPMWQDNITATDSASHGWIVKGSDFNPALSSRYLVHADGTPFVGIGHSAQRHLLDVGGGAEEFGLMRANNQNIVHWAPFDGNSFFQSSYTSYEKTQLSQIDGVMSLAAENDLMIVLSIWSRRLLRTNAHELGDGRYIGHNGFSRDFRNVEEFFTDPEAWEWQKNLYRYMIARWSAMKSLGVWELVEFATSTAAYENFDPWFEEVVEFFRETDPYRHPVSAARGWDTSVPTSPPDLDWPEGHQLLDVATSALFDFWDGDILGGAIYIADTTKQMWDRVEKPVWISEYAMIGDHNYPEMSHYASWAGLASGGAMIPFEVSEVNSSYGTLTPEMRADFKRLAEFASFLDMATWDPVPVTITSNQSQIRGWGLVGDGGGAAWILDTTMAGRRINDLRAYADDRVGVRVTIEMPRLGTYPTVFVYDPWLGDDVWTGPVDCQDGTCEIDLPAFHSDLAIRFVIRTQQETRILASVSDGAVGDVEGETTVKKGSVVRIIVQSDVEDTVQIEGYEATGTTGPEEIADFSFRASQEGTFVVSLAGLQIELFTLTVE